LINSGLFHQLGSDLVYTGKFPSLVAKIKNFVPNSLLEDADWQTIRENPLIEISPFKDEIKEILLDLAEGKELTQVIDIERVTEPLIEIVSDAEEEIIVPEIDILSEGTQYVKTNRRVRNSVWSSRVKKEFIYSCVVPHCDILGKEFVQAAHIKPDAVIEQGTPHRAHILNGLCMCHHCHIAFDKGFISLDDNFNLIVSSTFDARIKEQHLKTIILSSNTLKIKSRVDNREPILDFVQYHRNNIFIT
jgi:putative restriction endonuclease